MAPVRSHPGDGASPVPLVALPQLTQIPEPGDPCPGFISEPGCCWQMVYDHNLQATAARNAGMDGQMVVSPRRLLVAGVGLSGPPRGADRPSGGSAASAAEVSPARLLPIT